MAEDQVQRLLLGQFPKPHPRAVQPLANHLFKTRLLAAPLLVKLLGDLAQRLAVDGQQSGHRCLLIPRMARHEQVVAPPLAELALDEGALPVGDEPRQVVGPGAKHVAPVVCQRLGVAASHLHEELQRDLRRQRVQEGLRLA